MRRSAALVLVVCAGLATACLPQPSEPTGEGPLVAIAGDSIAWAAENGPGYPDEPDESFLAPLLHAAGFSSTFTALQGASTADLAPVEWAAEPDILVIVMGHNDLREGGPEQVPHTEALANIDAFTGRWPDACLVLTTIPETTPWSLDVNAPPYNAGLAARADVLLDWATTAAGEPELLEEDGVHHADEGARFRVEVLEAVEACSGSSE